MNTSLAAKKSMDPHRTELQMKLLLRIRDAGADGMTCDELEAYFIGKVHQTVSPRVRELYLMGWIYRTRRTRPTRSGRQAKVYRARRVRQPPSICTCDKPTCSRFPCKILREYRVTHRVVSEIVGEPHYGVDTLKKLLRHIECECEILVK